MIDQFFAGYCAVEFLCVEESPNWLGWLLLVFMFGMIAIPVFTVIDNFLEFEKEV